MSEVTVDSTIPIDISNFNINNVNILLETIKQHYNESSKFNNIDKKVTQDYIDSLLNIINSCKEYDKYLNEEIVKIRQKNIIFSVEVFKDTDKYDINNSSNYKSIDPKEFKPVEENTNKYFSYINEIKKQMYDRNINLQTGGTNYNEYLKEIDNMTNKYNINNNRNYMYIINNNLQGGKGEEVEEGKDIVQSVNETRNILTNIDNVTDTEKSFTMKYQILWVKIDEELEKLQKTITSYTINSEHYYNHLETFKKYTDNFKKKGGIMLQSIDHGRVSYYIDIISRIKNTDVFKQNKYDDIYVQCKSDNQSESYRNKFKSIVLSKKLYKENYTTIDILYNMLTMLSQNWPQKKINEFEKLREELYILQSKITDINNSFKKVQDKNNQSLVNNKKKKIKEIYNNYLLLNKLIEWCNETVKIGYKIPNNKLNLGLKEFNIEIENEIRKIYTYFNTIYNYKHKKINNLKKIGKNYIKEIQEDFPDLFNNGELVVYEELLKNKIELLEFTNSKIDDNNTTYDSNNDDIVFITTDTSEHYIKAIEDLKEENKKFNQIYAENKEFKKIYEESELQKTIEKNDKGIQKLTEYKEEPKYEDTITYLKKEQILNITNIDETNKIIEETSKLIVSLNEKYKDKFTKLKTEFNTLLKSIIINKELFNTNDKFLPKTTDEKILNISEDKTLLKPIGNKRLVKPIDKSKLLESTNIIVDINFSSSDNNSTILTFTIINNNSSTYKKTIKINVDEDKDKDKKQKYINYYKNYYYNKFRLFLDNMEKKIEILKSNIKKWKKENFKEIYEINKSSIEELLSEYRSIIEDKDKNIKNINDIKNSSTNNPIINLLSPILMSIESMFPELKKVVKPQIVKPQIVKPRKVEPQIVKPRKVEPQIVKSQIDTLSDTSTYRVTDTVIDADEIQHGGDSNIMHKINIINTLNDKNELLNKCNNDIFSRNDIYIKRLTQLTIKKNVLEQKLVIIENRKTNNDEFKNLLENNKTKLKSLNEQNSKIEKDKPSLKKEKDKLLKYIDNLQSPEKKYKDKIKHVNYIIDKLGDINKHTINTPNESIGNEEFIVENILSIFKGGGNVNNNADIKDIYDSLKELNTKQTKETTKKLRALNHIKDNIKINIKKFLDEYNNLVFDNNNISAEKYNELKELNANFKSKQKIYKGELEKLYNICIKKIIKLNKDNNMQDLHNIDSIDAYNSDIDNKDRNKIESINITTNNTDIDNEIKKMNEIFKHHNSITTKATISSNRIDDSLITIYPITKSCLIFNTINNIQIKYGFILLNFIKDELDAYNNLDSKTIGVYLRINDFKGENSMGTFFDINADSKEVNKNYILNQSKLYTCIETNKTAIGEQEEEYKKYADNISSDFKNLDKETVNLFDKVFITKDFSKNDIIANYLSYPTFLKNGKSIMLITYGYSGVGKTFTLFGSSSENGMLQSILEKGVGDTKYFRIFEIYGVGLPYTSYWENNIKHSLFTYKFDKNIKLEKVEEKISDDSINKYINNIKEFNNTEGNDVPPSKDIMKDYNILETEHIKDFSTIIADVDKERINKGRIKHTVNNPVSSRSIMVYEFVIKLNKRKNNKNYVNFIIIDLPGKEDIEKSYVNIPDSIKNTKFKNNNFGDLCLNYKFTEIINNENKDEDKDENNKILDINLKKALYLNPLMISLFPILCNLFINFIKRYKDNSRIYQIITYKHDSHQFTKFTNYKSYENLTNGDKNPKTTFMNRFKAIGNETNANEGSNSILVSEIISNLIYHKEFEILFNFYKEIIEDGESNMYCDSVKINCKEHNYQSLPFEAFYINENIKGFVRIFKEKNYLDANPEQKKNNYKYHKPTPYFSNLLFSAKPHESTERITTSIENYNYYNFKDLTNNEALNYLSNGNNIAIDSKTTNITLEQLKEDYAQRYFIRSLVYNTKNIYNIANDEILFLEYKNKQKTRPKVNDFLSYDFDRSYSEKPPIRTFLSTYLNLEDPTGKKIIDNVYLFYLVSNNDADKCYHQIKLIHDSVDFIKEVRNDKSLTKSNTDNDDSTIPIAVLNKEIENIKKSLGPSYPNSQSNNTKIKELIGYYTTDDDNYIIGNIDNDIERLKNVKQILLRKLYKLKQKP